MTKRYDKTDFEVFLTSSENEKVPKKACFPNFLFFKMVMTKKNDRFCHSFVIKKCCLEAVRGIYDNYDKMTRKYKSIVKK